jgi:DNA-binding transcriptional ArsR family regulator
MLEIFTAVGRAVADPSRVRILKMLEDGELCVCQITAILGLSSATVSKHLSLLKMAGLVTQRKEGRWVYYRLISRQMNPYAPSMLELLAGFLADDPVVEEDRRRLDQVNSLSVQTLCRMGPHPFDSDGRLDPALFEIEAEERRRQTAAARPLPA